MSVDKRKLRTADGYQSLRHKVNSTQGRLVTRSTRQHWRKSRRDGLRDPLNLEWGMLILHVSKFQASDCLQHNAVKGGTHEV